MHTKSYAVGGGMTPTDSIVGSFMREKRLGLGFSQKTVAELFGLSITTISSYELGKFKYLSEKRLKGFAEVYRTPVGEFRKRVPPMEPYLLGINMKASESEAGNSLRLKRLELGLSQAMLSKLSGVRIADICALEAGKYVFFHPKRLKRFANVLGFSPEEVLEMVPKKVLPTPKTKLGKTIQSEREKNGLTLEELAKKLGITLQQTKVLEFGYQKREGISYKRAKQLVKVFPDTEPSVFYKFVSYQKKKSTNKLGRRVSTRRMELGMSAVELAKKLGTSRQTISQIELGQVRFSEHVSDYTVECLEKALGLPEGNLQVLRPERKNKKQF